jgi:chromosome segregation and condensation protein ScpB
MQLEQKIEAILFWKGEAVSRKKLAEIFKVSQSDIDESVEKLKINLQNRGVALMEKDDDLVLGTAPELAQLFEQNLEFLVIFLHFKHFIRQS